MSRNLKKSSESSDNDSQPAIRQALHDAVARLESRLRRRFRRMIRPFSSVFDGDDFIMEIHKHIAGFSGKSSLRDRSEVDRYLYGMAKRIALGLMRRETRQRRRRQVFAILNLSDGAPRNGDGDDAEELDAILAQLSDEERSILTPYASGETHVQIAESLGLTLAACWSRWRRLRARVRENVEWRGGTRTGVKRLVGSTSFDSRRDGGTWVGEARQRPGTRVPGL